jgi:hypothetical protein
MGKIGGINVSAGRFDGQPALGCGEYYLENFPYS